MSTNNQIEFYLNNQQVDYIQTKLPQGFSLHLSSLVHQREQRISKKVSKFDATFKSNKLEQNSQEDYPKRVQRVQPPLKKEENNKVLKVLQKFKSHNCFDEIYDTIADKFDIENVEAQINGNMQILQNELKKFLKIATQVNQKNSRSLEAINQLENYYCELFKLPPMKKKTPIQQQQIQQQQIQQQQQQQQTQQIQSKMLKPMTFQEKLNLGESIRMLKPEYLRGVWEIVQESVAANGDEEIEFDIDVLPVKVARKLEQYVQSKIQQKKQKPNEEEEKSIDPESSDQ